MNKYIIEFIGTFFLVFTVGMAAVFGGAGDLAPFAISAVLMAMIYAGGHISGAHYNPAVTLAIWIRGGIGIGEGIIYMIVQVVAAAVAALTASYLNTGVAVEPIAHNVPASLLVEFLFTFALAFVILNVATAKATEGNSYFGLAIGFTVLAGALTVGDVSGGAFNPVVAVGVTMMGLSSWADIWIYLAATFVGGAVAAGVFKMVNSEE